jgi:hypothetical protein
MYTSSPIKNVKISYKHSIQYYEGKGMYQLSPKSYSDTETPVTNNELFHVYQTQDESISTSTNERVENPILNLITLEDNI